VLVVDPATLPATGSRQVKVRSTDYVGLTWAAAARQLRRRGLGVTVSHVEAGVRSGTVVAATPNGRLPRRSVVLLLVSR
jgi:beta-lactam-binding protein with PASTA domain